MSVQSESARLDYNKSDHSPTKYIKEQVEGARARTQFYSEHPQYKDHTEVVPTGLGKVSQ